METYRSQLTGKTYQVATWTQPLINVDTGKPEQYFRKIAGVINGVEVLLDMPVSTDRLAAAHSGMMRGIERYLDGQHNVTHYAGFPEIVAAKVA